MGRGKLILSLFPLLLFDGYPGFEVGRIHSMVGGVCQLPRHYWQKTEELLPSLPSLEGVPYCDASSLGSSTLRAAK
jgi:hypothetical protein